MKTKRFTWTPQNVSAKNTAAMTVRTYIEQKQLRDLLMIATENQPIESALEVGCGFGRMTQVLGEFAMHVVGAEREKQLLITAKKLLPRLNFEWSPKLYQIAGEYDLAMTFTVLQHMSDAGAAKVIDELKRVSRKFILLVEDTDPEHHFVDKDDPSHFTHGRSVEQYEDLMDPWVLTIQSERRVEPGFSYKGQPRETVGHFMLFEPDLKDDTYTETVTYTDVEPGEGYVTTIPADVDMSWAKPEWAVPVQPHREPGVFS